MVFLSLRRESILKMGFDKVYDKGCRQSFQSHGEGHKTAANESNHKQDGPPLPGPLLPRREERENLSDGSVVLSGCAFPGGHFPARNFCSSCDNHPAFAALHGQRTVPSEQDMLAKCTQE